ncbi:hypothetical protein BOTCAL_0743g00010 [Botryotinia calthae]|uniref:Uncharacterized protein n=1 Tax=Botryotinia calthae TaxID=38488 RepID=A0A4Y8CJ25_9HELO|nr:hypothetical protein BOTCAL_0743g00010 [Botryotinia calthae]
MDVLVIVGKLCVEVFKVKDKKCLEKYYRILWDFLAEYDVKRAAFKVTLLIDLLLWDQGKGKGKSVVISDSCDEEDEENESFQ